MSFELPPIARTEPPPPVARPAGPALAGAGFAGTLAKVADAQVPDAMPPALWQEIDLAALRAQELHDAGRELHFSRDEESGRITVEVRDGEGRLIRRLPLTEAIDIAAGGPLRV